jgi:type II secretion system protein N
MRFSVKPLLRLTAYLLYTLVVLAVMLWFQFPSAAVRQRLEYQLQTMTPGLQWSIGNISLALPVDILLTDIKITDKNGAKKPLFVVDSLSLRPSLQTLLKARKLSADYRFVMLGGYLSGGVRLGDDHKTFLFSGKANGLDMTGLKDIVRGFDRTVSGILSASFTGKYTPAGSGGLELDGKVELLKGEISFLSPVLGMDKLAFNQLSSRVQYGSAGIRIANGRLDSRLLSGDFSGTVEPGDVFSAKLEITGGLIPRPEFLATIGDPAMVKLVKKQLKGGSKLPFTISGTLEEPGIDFTGLPTGTGQRTQGGGK